uniref:Secreted protein n=1 Tax=Mesocestoides corti TaxID=53468 RepID=A0A5K3G0Y7_MESCO
MQGLHARIFIWLAAYLPRMPLKRRETQDWLRLAWLNMSAPLCVSTVKYPSRNRKKIGTTKQALLTNQKTEPRVRRHPSESTTLATPPIIYCISSMSFSGWLPSFPACHGIAERHGIG